MRLLLDNNLSHRLIGLLSSDGFDVIHVRDLGLAAASDAEILHTAADANRVIISADSDFGALLAARQLSRPSYVLLRRINGRRAEDIASLLAANLPALRGDLDGGAIVVVADHDIRIRRLPIGIAGGRGSHQSPRPIPQG
jgi:predicted nuclease of predicted toxin-antitoxin system